MPDPADRRLPDPTLIPTNDPDALPPLPVLPVGEPGGVRNSPSPPPLSLPLETLPTPLRLAPPLPGDLNPKPWGGLRTVCTAPARGCCPVEGTAGGGRTDAPALNGAAG